MDPEARRLEALRSYRILDTDPEKGFDDLTHLATFICQTPIALISLIDAERQWFKSCTGIEATETPRDLAFCSHAIQHKDLFIVPDALEDERFKNNPLVVSEPRIRFYAGAPLITAEGHALGSLCVIDREPRQISDKQKQALRSLRNQVLAQLELRRNLMELRDALRARDMAEEIQKELVSELRRSIKNVKKLSGMIPLCSVCRFDMTIPAQISSIDTVTEGVLQMLSASNRRQGDDLEIETALREALVNAIKHGCGQDPSKKIQCCVTCDDSGEVMIVVRDPGTGFDPAGVPDPLSPENRSKNSGRGVFLINELMDEVRYADGGREVRMKKSGSNLKRTH